MKLWYALILGLVLLSLWFWVDHTLELRNECECKDLMECQTNQLATILSNNSSDQLYKTISTMRFFPDDSGSYFVMDYNGTIYADSELGICEKKDVKEVPVHRPFTKIVDLAKKGGGYVKYEWKGRQKTAYVKPVPEQNLLLCSSMYTDWHSIKKRRKWNLVQKQYTKQGKSNKK